MTWTKIPDEWVDRREFSMLPAEDRWHYLCMLTFASRGDYLDGVLSVTQALRVSDHPNPQSALDHLEDVGLIEMSSASPIVRLTEIEVHVPPPSKRTDATGAGVSVGVGRMSGAITRCASRSTARMPPLSRTVTP